MPISDIQREYEWSEEKINKMYTYLKGFCTGAGLNESVKALYYAREKHKGQYRKNGVPYIMHPLSMAYYAVRLGIIDDNIIAVTILHDVCEDCGVKVEDLPFNDIIKRGVKYMTITKFGNEEKSITKDRYFNELLESREAIIAKALDRMVNLADMEGNMPVESIIKNVKETDEKLLSKLKEAEYKYPDLANALFILRTNIKYICRTLGCVHSVYAGG